MITFPNAKINLGLHVLEKRKDGFHNIESCFYPVPLTDALEIIPSEEFSFTSSGLQIPGNPQDNLIMKVLNLLGQFRELPNTKIHLHKVIPMGAGLGGGSADATFALKMLDTTLQLNLTPVQLKSLAAQLGSDCAFFLENKPAIATDKGSKLKGIELDLDAYEIRFIHPRVSISTAEAYSLVTPRKRKTGIAEILRLPVDQWPGNLINDFEEPIMNRYPEIRQAKEDLLSQGATYAAMSGSGSSVYGLFTKN